MMSPGVYDEKPVPPFAAESAVESESVPADSVPSAAVCAKRFVELAVVEKKLVEVALPRIVAPVAVKFVVDAPPFMLKSPLVIVEEAFERKPLVKVWRPVHVLALPSEAPVRPSEEVAVSV